MLIIRSRRNAQRKRIPRSDRVGAAKKQITCASAITMTFMSLSLSVERWTLDVFTSAANAERPTPNIERRILQTLGFNRCADQTLLPLHLSFCRTTLKNEASGNDASGSVFFALRMVTIDPRSTWIGLRPSSVRYTG